MYSKLFILEGTNQFEPDNVGRQIQYRENSQVFYGIVL